VTVLTDRTKTDLSDLGMHGMQISSFNTRSLARVGPQAALGYIITLTEAPNDLGGRLSLNEARTAPELPAYNQHRNKYPDE
jgi:hypothetical protein